MSGHHLYTADKPPSRPAEMPSSFLSQIPTQSLASSHRATFDLKKASAKAKPAFAATFIKLVGFVAVFLPIAVAFGFRDSELIAILVMLGSATTVSCFVMARNMGHEGVISSTTIMLTTLLSAFTLTLWLYIIKSLGLV